MTEPPVLEFDAARISFFLRAGEANVIPGLSFSVGPREAFGLVGESGSGKSTVALAIMRYLGRAGAADRRVHPVPGWRHGAPERRGIAGGARP